MSSSYNSCEKDHSYSNSTTQHKIRLILSLFIRRLSRLKIDKILTVLLLIGLFLICINLHKLSSIVDKASISCTSPQSLNKTYAVHGKRVDSGYLFHVFDTLHSIGFKRTELNDEWDVLWSHDYPFSVLKDRLSYLKPGQKVNHFPGSGYVTNKLNLATSEYSFVPRAFQIPKGKDDLIQYASKNPSTMFVQKSNNHRGIKIEKIENLDLTKTGSFIQTYVSNPLLIDGHKFDIGVYVVVTSLEPLRIYIYGGDILFRFCPVSYHPFDPAILDKYVVGDDYLPLWKVDSLKHSHLNGFSMKNSFDSYIAKKGKDPSKIWTQVEDAIRSIYLTKESLMIESWRKFEKKRNFFELVRFDFVIDENLKVFLMEVNMSPNLSSQHFPPNKLLYEQVLFSTFSLVGVGNLLTSSGTRIHDSRSVSKKQIFVDYLTCSVCINCDSDCKICPDCTSEEEVEILKEAYLEQSNKMEFRRIFPTTHSTHIKSDLSSANKWMSSWYEAKCKLDSSWCN